LFDLDRADTGQVVFFVEMMAADVPSLHRDGAAAAAVLVLERVDEASWRATEGTLEVRVGTGRGDDGGRRAGGRAAAAVVRGAGSAGLARVPIHQLRLQLAACCFVVVAEEAAPEVAAAAGRARGGAARAHGRARAAALADGSNARGGGG
jgi:hypothetical protein